MTERGNFVLNGNRHFPFSSSHPLPFPFFSSLSFFLPFTILLHVVHTIISYYSTLARKSDTVGFFNLLDATQFKFIRCIELKFHTQAWQWLNISIWSSAIYSKMERQLFNAYHDGILIRSQALNCIAVLCKKLHPASRLFSIKMKCIYKIRLFEVIYWKQCERERERDVRACVCVQIK